MTVVCSECGLLFVSDDDERDVCVSCEMEWMRENHPELLGEQAEPLDSDQGPGI